MTEKTSSNEPTSAPAASSAVGPSKGLVLTLVLIPVLMIVLTPIIVFMMIKQMSPKLPIESISGGKAQIMEIALPKIQVNVAGTNGTRYAEIDVVVTITDSSMKKFFEEQSEANPQGRLRKMISIISEIIGSKNLNELLSTEYRDRLKKEIRTALNDILKEETNGVVRDVYFPRFLIQ